MNNEIRLFDIDEIHMIGNFDNGAVIGLDEEGFAYLDKADPKVCNEKKREEINKALKEMGFLDKKEKRFDVRSEKKLEGERIYEDSAGGGIN